MLDGQDVQTGESELIEGAQQPQGESQQPANPPEELDPDQAELASAREALEKEGKEPAAGDGQQQQPNQGQQAGQQQQQQPGEGEGQQQQQQTKPIMIPKERLDASLSKQEELRNAAFYWKGRAEAAGAGGGQPPKGGQPQQPAKTPEQQVADLRTQKMDLVRKFDSGTITAEELETKRDQIEDQIHAIRNKPAAPAQSGDSLYLETLTAQLEEKHPYLLVIEDQDHWRFLTVEATKSLAKQGQPLPKGELSDTDRLRLRAEVAKMSDTWGPQLTGKSIAPNTQAAGQQPSGQQPPAKNVQPPSGAPKGPTAQQRLTKLHQAASAPPNLNGVGQSGNPEGEVSDASIENMNEDEINALPKATRDRMMGRLPSQR